MLKDAPAANIKISLGTEDISGRKRTGLRNAMEFFLLSTDENNGIAGHTQLEVSDTTNVFSATGH
jgi:hypothetical protein